MFGKSTHIGSASGNKIDIIYIPLIFLKSKNNKVSHGAVIFDG
jgi:hypothetical protein